MPCTHQNNDTHREKQGTSWQIPACVARPVGKREIEQSDKAKEAIKKEWTRMWEKNVFGLEIREWADVAREARDANRECHMGIVFGLMFEKNSQMQDETKRKYKYRIVFQGNKVINQDWESAIFMDGSSKPVAMEVGKIADWYACLPGHAQQQSDAVQAYIQADLRGCVLASLCLERDTREEHLSVFVLCLL